MRKLLTIIRSQYFLKHLSYPLVLGMLLGITIPAKGQTFPTFSVDPASPSIDGGLTPDDFLVEGPGIFIEGRDLGLNDEFFTGLYDNLNALSYGLDPIQDPLYFSVNRVAIGLPGTAVNSQAQPFFEEAHGDVYKTLPPFGNNSLVIEEEELGLEGGFFGDDLDALDLDTLPNPKFVYFSVDKWSNPHGPLEDDILISERNDETGEYEPFTVFAGGPEHIGIDELDDLDALILWDVFKPGELNPGIDMALFSLSTFSPSTFTFTQNEDEPEKEYIPGKKGNLSPADILWTDFTGDFDLWDPAEEIGLFPDDELNALDTLDGSPPPIPEPSTILGIIVLGGLGIIGRKKKNSR